MYVVDRVIAALQKIRANPQLIYTVTIAVLIVFAFVFMASRFIGIATDAQDRLVNVRIGSLQDAFVTFASDRIAEPTYLNDRIAAVMQSNETIHHFQIIQRQVVYVPATTTAYIIIASNDPKEIGTAMPQAEFLYSLASSDSSHSVTIETSSGLERLFNTARAIVGPEQNVLGVAMTTQTLSAADKAIESNITKSLYLLVAVIVMILFLFLRHSRIIDYMDLYRRLKQVDQLKDDFISMASHELRSPLTIIRGYADFLKKAPDLYDELKGYAQRIESGSKDLEVFIADMLDVSRIEQGRMTFNMERCEAQVMVHSVVDSYLIPAKDKGLALSFNTSRANAQQFIQVDKDRFRQVLVNLIGNAIKYTPKGSVEVSQYEENDRLCIRVSDTGLGISAEQREKLFQKFYRIRSKETEAITGTGLGLWITAQIVREMRGTITVESIVGVGSHFIVSFPLVH